MRLLNLAKRDVTPKIVFITILFQMLTLLIVAFRRGEVGLISVVPDDSFYYFAIARSFAENGAYAIDSVNPTSGFNVLNLITLIILFKIFKNPTIEVFVLIFFAIFLLVFIYCFYTLIQLGRQFGIKGNKWLLCLLPMMSWPMIFQAVSAMDSWAPLLVSGVLVNKLSEFRSKLAEKSLKTAMLIGALLSIGILGRFDFIVFSASIFIFMIVLKIWRGGLLTIAGIIFVTLFTLNIFFFSITKEFGQDSSRMKLFWFLVEGSSPKDVISFVVRAIFPQYLLVPRWVTLIVLLVIVSLVLRGSAQNIHSNTCKPAQKYLWQLSIIYICLYLVILLINSSGIQHWYSPILSFMLSVLFLTSLSNGYRKLTDNLIAPILVALFFYSLLPGSGSSRLPNSYQDRVNGIPTKIYPHQLAPFRAAQLLNEEMDLRINSLGAWNAGVLNWYYREVINLDGLVNNAANRYVREKKLGFYLLQTQITHILDFDRNIEYKYLVERSGLTPPETRCLARSRSKMNDDEDLLTWGYSLYTLDKDCLIMNFKPPGT